MSSRSLADDTNVLMTAGWGDLPRHRLELVLCVETDVRHCVSFADLPADSKIRFVTFAEAGDAVTETPPGLVVSPAFAGRFDCIDLARLLKAIDYQGAYRVLADLPRPEMVRDEVRAEFPTLDFDVLTPAQQPLARAC